MDDFQENEECNQSGKVYNLKSIVRNSHGKQTAKEETTESQCVICKKSFSKKGNLKAHAAKVHNNKCEVCCKSFGYKKLSGS